MLKKTSIALIAGLMLATGGVAMADEYLETTGSRNPAQANQSVAQQDRAPVRQRNARQTEIRSYYNQAPSISAPAARSNEQRAKVDPLIGSGG